MLGSFFSTEPSLPSGNSYNSSLFGGTMSIFKYVLEISLLLQLSVSLLLFSCEVLPFLGGESGLHYASMNPK